MRPIWMKLKGLNSFLETQEVDFEQLTSQGLFGIFGPTGSGKSSILDGISLALYGTTARNSTNFINVNTDKASVEYLFSVKTKRERRYLVSRSFKRSKEGSIRSDGAKLVELEATGQKILADRVGTVNEACREILGLSREDFFRTVVLPQGKFSEFLKLEGMERNKMLERLFHLEQYGEHLAALVKNRVQQWDGQKLEKEGALSRYAQVSEEQIAELRKQEQEIQVALKKNEEKQKTVQAQLEEAKAVAEYQKEYEKLLQEAQVLADRKEEMELLGQNIRQAEIANGLVPWLLEARETRAQAVWQEQEKERFYSKWKERQEQLEQAELQKKETEERSQEEQPKLQLQIELLNQAMALEEERREEEKNGLIQEQKRAENQGKLQDANKKMEGLLADIEHKRQQREALLTQLQEIAVPAEMIQAAAEGDRVTRELEQAEKQKQNLQKKAKRAEKDWETGNQKQQEISRKKQEKQQMFWQAEQEIAALKERLETWKNMEKEKEALFQLRESCEKEQELIKKIQDQVKALEETNLSYETACEERDAAAAKKTECDRFYLEHMAGMLAAGLQEGEPCPVCGSIHHSKEISERKQEDMEALMKEKQKAEQEFQKSLTRVSSLETSLGHIRENLDSLKEQQKGFIEENPGRKYEEAMAAYEAREKEHKAAESLLEEKTSVFEENQKEFYELQNQEAGLLAKIQSLSEQIQETKAELERISKETVEPEKRLQELKQRFQTEDFCAFYQNIQEKLKFQEEIQNRKNQLETQIDARVKNSEKGKKIIEELRTEVTKSELFIDQSKKRILELKQQIQEKAGTTEFIQEKKESLEQRLAALERAKKQAVSQWEALQKDETALRESYTEQKTRSQAAREQAEKKEKSLELKMKETGVEERCWIEEHQQDESVLQAAKDERKAYEEAVIKSKTQVEQAAARLGGRCVQTEQIEILGQENEHLLQEMKEGQKAFGAVKKEREQMEKSWEEKKKLLQELEKVYHKLNLLTELEGLFRGKRFVEYVSRYYLEYVSREADQQLRQMTGSSYGLETDGNGMFLIRDYKNGGALRPASTLSGGETFMASLALALALSSQIQMKGAAPLELFFLDEGFGTLDETCLEVVMESLENIRTKRRSVGVITHVEEIKNRIPVRLLVEPARMGEGGSKIRIEEA